MTQATPIIGANKSGLQYRTEDNDGKKALLNHHKGATAPSYAEAGMIWLDDAATPWALKCYDGADWIRLGDINATTNTFAPYQGTAGLRLLNDAADTGSANAYAVAPSPAITAYTTGQIVLLRPVNTNTGSSTLNINGLGVKNIKLLDGSNPASGALVTTGIYQLVYDGINFVLLNPSGAAAGAMTLINTQTVSSSVASVTVTGFSSTYKRYVLVISNLTCVSSADNLRLQFSTDNGSTFLTATNYRHNISGATYTSGGTTGYTSANGTDNAGLGRISDSTNGGAAYTVNFNQMAVSGKPTFFVHGASHDYYLMGYGIYNSTVTANAIKIFTDSININGGTFTLYGMN